MAVPTVRPCLPQRCVCRNTNCGITQRESAWKPRTSNLSFKRLLWSPALRKGDWDIAQIPNQIESLKDNCLKLSCLILWIQAHGDQSPLSCVLQSEKDPWSVHTLSEWGAGLPEKWEETAQPQPAFTTNSPDPASPASLPAISFPKHVIWCRGKWKRGGQPSLFFSWRRPRANEAQ